MGERKRVSVACEACRKSHLKCDNGRPCQRCLQKGIADSCRTADTRRQKGVAKARKKRARRSLYQPKKDAAGDVVNSVEKLEKVGIDSSGSEMPLTIREAGNILMKIFEEESYFW
eukprot:TRINITY_DN9892_c0_g1_i1.p1 TRINITY_DN9892_c0_g1~~TRINITY_DN9892_c0_g1_i1.p1  ORF type:complete len:115 (-),score=19.62 TRINITY_DN9892_c0_g1_i1:159-503(-)